MGESVSQSVTLTAAAAGAAEFGWYVVRYLQHSWTSFCGEYQELAMLPIILPSIMESCQLGRY